MKGRELLKWKEFVRRLIISVFLEKGWVSREMTTLDTERAKHIHAFEPLFKSFLEFPWLHRSFESGRGNKKLNEETHGRSSSF